MFHAGKWFLAAFASLGLAGFAPADEPKAPDLSDLRDAVKAAAKRGNNLREVHSALDVLEKSLAKGWSAPNGGTVSAPPELTALRDAVEAAGRKGENVEDIRKELDAIEKAMTGRTFTPPKPAPPPEPQLIPTPPVGRGGLMVQGGGGNRVIVNGVEFGGVAGASMSITLSGQNFTLKSAQNGVRYTITGTIGADGATLEKITVADGDKKPVDATSVKDLPEEYRATVEKLVKRVNNRR